MAGLQEAGILDGHGHLAGEDLGQFDLLRAEVPLLRATCQPKSADNLTFDDKRNQQQHQNRKVKKTFYQPHTLLINSLLFTLLANHHQLPYDSNDLVKIGERVIRETLAELEKISRRIDPGKDWAEIVSEIRKSHPTKENLLSFYQEQMQKSHNYLKDRELVTLPEDEKLEVVESPVFVRHLIPYAAYMSPAPLEKNQKGFYWVTPVDPSLPAEKQEEQLQGHNIYKSVVTTLHEGYPGHHMQLVISNRNDSKVRRLFGTSVFWEGWALYCEEMMYEQGYYTDIRSRLFQLKDQLWRGCRVVIDVKLHTKKMTFDQAVDMLVNVAKLE